ncbi:MAG: low molecular weight phosphotyrosine protein phosphatase [Sulfurovum sp.]|nr:low molecular weight phosphotyrosine protein phosphatase [Sulfurovum sp.]MCB4750409.1 low molecular weight phosphotyrosine protein phosphatase [Sulfurovum sp.]MCB4753216.1 low molecular weight phosphotyrosine protein phosphatase [Sulfurovum sp.]MCB4772710.1 low molecular weight phosphotyrosine protein phosphatase [Sulfurovum sp.]MCB4776001.1 low molecular weight phosphotyrosine protein phosphatase [Sulfurovum sp.]
MKRILFVCLGNICRSPLAEGIAHHYLIQKSQKTIEIDSAGTSEWHKGEAPCKHSIEVAQQHNIDISSQRSRPVTQSDQYKFDYIVALDKQNRNDLEIMGFQNIYLLGDFGSHGGEDVPDPYFFNGFEGFEKVYNMIETAVKDLIEKVEHGCI